MKPQLKVTVGRQEPYDDSPLAWELHRKRAEIVHQELGKDPDWKVVNWGEELDDTERTHEDATVIIELAQAAGTMALVFAGSVLYRVLEDTVVEAIKKLIKKFVPRLRKKEVTRVYVELPNGETVEWSSPGYYGEVDIWLSSRVSLSMEELESEANSD